ncbi:hypothetical protein HJC23_000445 [Cyclotella cryptica]|uniref:Protein-serine/threonine kinase n=1 Tax=Cyclotella cryptica TaxID=29204 RepID=A0ABD3QAM1_9STRA|eukprot:CCRYP_007191-RA/>CCRYP_007191-RA protein AED:0.02 eAED:0.02 QI:176/1/1/1/1/1/2/80/435
MSNAAHKFQSSLLSNVNPSGLRRWSARALIDLGSCVTPENTTTLLQEVLGRLAVQLGRLNAWKEEVDTIEYSTRPQNNSKVIRACNFPVSMSLKEHSYRVDMAKSEREKTLKYLKDLIQLHENTSMLPYEVLNGDGRAILSSFTKPNQRYIDGIFDQIETRHGNSVETLADAVISARNVEEILTPLKNDPVSRLDLLNDSSIESFLHSRLLIQLLCEHYISLHKGKPTGAISLDADLVDVVEDAVQDAKQVCDANLGVCPEVIIRPMETHGSKDFIARPLIRSWSHHAIVELSKNAMKSNIERWEKVPSVVREQLPPAVFVKVIRDTDHLAIQVVDQGVGLDEERTQKAFRFASSSSQSRWNRLEAQQSYCAVREPLGSLGVGLPISRMMLRAFGGDLFLVNRDSGVKISENEVLASGCTATMKILYDASFTAMN